MMMSKYELHIPVLLEPVLKNLAIKPDGCYVDATVGRGGHAFAVLAQLNNKGRLYGVDQDEAAIKYLDDKIKKLNIKNFILIHNSFSFLKYELALHNVNQVDGILLDLGVSSPQINEVERGFSYHQDAPLDMRMNQQQRLTAYYVVNEYSQDQLQKILTEYGEVPAARRMVSAIVKARQIQPIVTTLELVKVIKSVLPQKVLKKQQHPARRVFQALRIEVNDELNQLRTVLQQATSLLIPGGRLVVIAFHSLEDRIIKNYFNQLCTDPQAELYQKLPIQSPWRPKFKIINRRIITSSATEQEFNRRSRSAKLRTLEKLNLQLGGHHE